MPGIATPDWPLPANVGACYTTRHGGVSRAPWQSFNLGAHVGDEPQAVAVNRARLGAALGDIRIAWLNQVHGNTVAHVRDDSIVPDADAAITSCTGLACAVLVADCVPILLARRDGTRIAAVHAGWRGLADGVIYNTVDAFETSTTGLSAWIGPAIGAAAYEVGNALRDTLTSGDPESARCFATRVERVHLDLQAWAEMQLRRAGVTSVYVRRDCVHADSQRYFSFRRDGTTGRQAALIWLKPPP